MAVKHVNVKLAGQLGDFSIGPPIVQAQLAGHGNSGEAECAVVFKAAQRHRDFAAAGARIANHTDLGAKLCLAERQIVHVAEDSSDGRT